MELELILLGLQALTPVVKALVAGHGVPEEQMRAILDFEAKAQAYAEQVAALQQATDPAVVAAAMDRAHAEIGQSAPQIGELKPPIGQLLHDPRSPLPDGTYPNP